MTAGLGAGLGAHRRRAAIAWAPETIATLNKLGSVERRLSQRYVGRERAVRLLQLAVLCREHVLLLGPPGTAKTDLVMRFADLVSAGKFSYLLTRFTEPSEIFGPLDLDEFHNSRYRIRVDGMLPEAQIAFLDEVFQGSSAILNSLLTLINERFFHNGAQLVPARLVTLIGAANELPDDPVLHAFADRLLLRLELAPVAGTDLEGLLAVGWERERELLAAAAPAPPVAPDGRGPGAAAPPTRERPIIDIAEVLGLSARVAEVDMSEAMPEYQDTIRELIAANVTLSDRRVVRGVKLVAGAALLRHAVRAQAQDLWPLMHFWTDPADVPAFAEIVQSRVDAGGGEPMRTVHTARQILTEAQYEYERALERLADGRVVPSAVERVLARLNQLRLELLAAHPHETAMAAQIRQMIDALIDAYGTTH